MNKLAEQAFTHLTAQKCGAIANKLGQRFCGMKNR